MYFAGLGVDKKYQTALHYFTMAGHQGHTRALFNLAQMHLQGLGTIKSCAIGVKLHKTVAERGNWATISNDAHRHYLKGNYAQAWMRYARAAEEGHEHAQANSAWMLDQGLGVAFLDQAQAEIADGSAAVASSSPVSRRYLLAHRHWSLASAQGNVDSLRMLGDYAFAGLGILPGGQPDYPQALKLYNQAAEQRNAQAMFNLGSVPEERLRELSGCNPDCALEFLASVLAVSSPLFCLLFRSRRLCVQLHARARSWHLFARFPPRQALLRQLSGHGCRRDRACQTGVSALVYSGVVGGILEW